MAVIEIWIVSLFQVTGLAVLVLGVWMTVDRVSLPFLQIMDTPIFQTAGYAMIGVGGFVTILGFFGCVGAWCENKCMLWTYFLFVFIILLAEIVCTILLFVFKSKVEQFLEKKMNETMIMDYGKADEDLSTQAIDAIQLTFDCCGTKSYKDWMQTWWYEAEKNTSGADAWMYPQSCCVVSGKDKIIKDGTLPQPMNVTACKGGDSIAVPNDAMHDNGCYDKIYTYIRNNIWIIAGVGLGVAVLQIFGLIFSICLLRNMKDFDYDD
ncbi:CD151 antigen-like [Glandiceps talaboti]